MSRTSFSVGLNGEVGRKYIAYDLFVDGYQINVSCIDILDSIKPDLDLVAKNLLSTLKMK